MADLLNRLSVALRDRYRVERELGRGGMATVYLAQDLKLDRLVAVKVLKPELAAELGGERFLREVVITARLKHKHILGLYDSGNEQGFLYYVMPYVSGESLRDRLSREKQLPVNDVLEIASAVADALSFAHSHGVIHRDVKPGNILLEAKHVYVSDFGIARAVDAAAGDRLTRSGVAVGTPHYMSPEQAAGETDLDHRTDQYSLACVVYEMLTGEPPYTGRSAQAIMAKQLTMPLPRASTLRDTVSSAVDKVLHRALAKMPADRFRTLEDFAAALEPALKSPPDSIRILSGPTARGRRRLRVSGVKQFLARIRARYRWGIGIAAALALLLASLVLERVQSTGPPRDITLDPSRLAVLFFEDLTPNNELQHMAAGLTQALIYELNQVKGLKVVSPGGVRPFARTNVSLDSIARVLNVGTIVEGSIERSGPRIRLTVQAVDPVRPGNVRSQRLERPLGELFALQDDLTQTIARFLRERIGTQVRIGELRRGARSEGAWLLVLRAENLAEPYWKAHGQTAELRSDDSRRALEQADSLLTRAEELDPDWSEVHRIRALTALGWAKLVGGASPDYEGWLRRAQEQAIRAVRTSPNGASVLTTLAIVNFRLGLALHASEDGQRLIARADSQLVRAVTIDSSLADAWQTLSEIRRGAGDLWSARRFAEQALAADTYLDEAPYVYQRLFTTSLDLEDFDAALHWARTGVRDFPNDPRFPTGLLAIESWSGIGAISVDSADAVVARLNRIDPPSSVGREEEYQYIHREAMFAGVLARAGATARAQAKLDSLRGLVAAQTAWQGPFEWDDAQVSLLLGDTTRALMGLERFVAHYPDLRQYVKQHFLFRALRSHAKFRALTELPE